MVDHYLIKIDTTYLTDDLSISGVKYISEIDGLPALQFTKLLTKKVDFRGNPKYNVQTVDQKNKELTIRCLGVEFAHIITIAGIKEANEGSSIELVGTHPYNSGFDFGLNVNFDSIEWNRMLTTQFRDVVMQFTSFSEI